MATIHSLGRAEIASPLGKRIVFTPDDVRVRPDIEGIPPLASSAEDDLFEKAGPRAKIFFDPQRTTFGIVSAGGLCPGINDVLRSIVLELRYAYGVPRIWGFRFGFAGLGSSKEKEGEKSPILLTPDVVRDIHTRPGSLLGTSRGKQDSAAMLDTLDRHEVDVLLTIGGDGTMRATNALAECMWEQQELRRQRGKRPIGFVGIPKTIDNDIPFVDKTFGFETAVAVARLAIDAAHAEARSVERGIGLVKLMGRSAGFVAARASLASRDVNACLVPEVKFDVERLLLWLEERLMHRGHAVLVVGEGCADQIPELGRKAEDGARATAAIDSSGNRRYGVSSGRDVGRYLQLRIEEYFHKSAGRQPVTLKYIDPSYMLRGTRSTSEDAVFCDALARNAVHAAMAGKTGMMVGRLHRAFVHVPLSLVLQAGEKRIDPRGELWRDVLETTGQPSFVEERATPHSSTIG